jgi:hypothetical protein
MTAAEDFSTDFQNSHSERITPREIKFWSFGDLGATRFTVEGQLGVGTCVPEEFASLNLYPT